MRIWFWFIVLAFFISCKSNQVIADTPVTEPTRSDIEGFPQSWKGTYTGTLNIFQPGSLTPSQSVPMDLYIDQIDVDSTKFEWNITYGEDKVKGLRQYQLITKDRDKGIFAIDERNSIVLDAHFIHGKLFSRFSVMGNLISATYEKQGDIIIFEIHSGKEKVSGYTGGQEDTPNVGLYPSAVYQKARLSKVERN